jgi:hypothetical protein
MRLLRMSFVRIIMPFVPDGSEEETKTSLRNSCYHNQREASWLDTQR